MNNFLTEVLQDLGAKPKSLRSKYFYDEVGDKLFQEIMNCNEYYPTTCEAEILESKAEVIARTLRNGFDCFDLLELGAGDATKTTFVLKELVAQGLQMTYMPVDISANIIEYLNSSLSSKIPGLIVEGLHGEYFEMVDEANRRSTNHKAVLFLGGNIGNMPPDQALVFCKKLATSLQKGDLVLLGFDLKKNPAVIRAAYSDSGGLTKAFNLNLLTRINKELDGNFDVSKFEHYASYDPATGACKSFLISLKPQEVIISGNKFHFDQDEYIYMEISQKYSLEEINGMAREAGFTIVEHFFDSKQWFLDTVWRVV
ncbi:MAG: Methyltransferase [Pedobacter sp.]|jgi:L-histidine N-alpha-methyltransferase|nr:Methyltransferase [Pedobacter sp.]